MPEFDTDTSPATLNKLITRSRDSALRVRVTDDQAKALYRRWNSALSTRLDYAVEFLGNKSLKAAVVDAWLDLEEEQGPLRTILDHHLHREALRPWIDQELSMLALAAGLTRLEDQPPTPAQMGLPFMLGLRGRIIIQESGIT